jgi:hypothetical protein
MTLEQGSTSLLHVLRLLGVEAMVLERQVADDRLPARGLRQLGLEPAPLRRGLRLTLHREELAGSSGR